MFTVRSLRMGLSLGVVLLAVWQFGLLRRDGEFENLGRADVPGAHVPAIRGLPGLVEPDRASAVGEDAALIAALGDPCADVRRAAAEGLGRAHPESSAVVAALVPLLRDLVPSVRLEAVRSLGRLGRPARPVIPELLPLQNDADPAVCRAATVALLTHIYADGGWTGGLRLLPPALIDVD